MRNWHKFFLLKNSKIDMNLERDQNYFDHERSMGGYSENDYYKNKELFSEKYFNNRYKFYNIFIKGNLFKKDKILSVGSGRCISELFLLNDGYNITCSDMEIPKCYEASKKFFVITNIKN